ncbi:MAG: hypothetical protein QMC90_00265 [Dehalococcoidales bacterium]|nr:hypothetical protein [Dehalococcoidales bacterium]
MGFVKTKVRVSNPSDASKYTEPELLVDTGATFTLIPSVVFQEIGVKADTKFKLKTADGRLQSEMGARSGLRLKARVIKFRS